MKVYISRATYIFVYNIYIYIYTCVFIYQIIWSNYWYRWEITFFGKGLIRSNLIFFQKHLIFVFINTSVKIFRVNKVLEFIQLNVNEKKRGK